MSSGPVLVFLCTIPASCYCAHPFSSIIGCWLARPKRKAPDGDIVEQNKDVVRHSTPRRLCMLLLSIVACRPLPMIQHSKLTPIRGRTPTSLPRSQRPASPMLSSSRSQPGSPCSSSPSSSPSASAAAVPTPPRPSSALNRRETVSTSPLPPYTTCSYSATSS